MPNHTPADAALGVERIIAEMRENADAVRVMARNAMTNATPEQESIRVAARNMVADADQIDAWAARLESTSRDERAALLAEVAAKDAWQPMATAPRDGSYFLMANYGEEANEGRYHDGSQNHWGEAGWYYADDDLLTSHASRPDVWMPLPTAPAAIEASTMGRAKD